MTEKIARQVRDPIHLFIHDDASPEGGGIQSTTYWMASYMAAKGLKVVVAGRQERSVFSGTGIEVFAQKSRFRTTHTSDIRLLVMLVRLRMRYGRNVILYSLLINNIKVFRWLRPILPWKAVSFLHGNETLRLLRRKPGTLRKSVLACLCVFANSRYTARLAGRLVDPRNVTVLSPGIPAARYRNYTRTPGRGLDRYRDRKTILMLSRLVKRKGHATMLQCVSRLKEKHPDILLLIAGSGAYRRRIEELREELSLQEHVGLIGFVPEVEKPALYDACRVYCMPSEVSEEDFDVEGFGITFLEASAMGKIVIGTNSGGIPDAVEDGRSGFLVEPGDVDGLTGLLDRILTHPEQFEEIRAYARRRALEEFDWDHRIDRTLEIVSDRLRREGRGA